VRHPAMCISFAPSSASRRFRGVWLRYGPLFACAILCSLSLTVSHGLSKGGDPQANGANTVAGGTRLYIRLEAEVSTKTSHLNETVKARVVRQISGGPGVLVPIGAEVTGQITKLIPSSDPTDHARLLIHFTQLAIPGHPTLNLAAHLVDVENARETVLQDGTIQGILEKDAAVGRADGMLDKLGTPGSEMEKVSGKAVGKFDTTIDYPAGTDMALTLDQPLTVNSTSPPAAAMKISPALADAVQKMLATAPSRAESKTRKPGDPLNLVVIGNSDQIMAAFKQAGWSEAKRLGARSAVGTVRAMASDEGYGQAPVSQLYLFGRAEDLAFEKMLNTFLKRHHLRLWRTTATTPDNREIWMGATTHDIGLDVHLGVISHAIDSDLDAERSKVGADLMAGGMVAAEQPVTRPNALSTGRTATGGTWKTDGQMLVIELKNSEGRSQ